MDTARPERGKNFVSAWNTPGQAREFTRIGANATPFSGVGPKVSRPPVDRASGRRQSRNDAVGFNHGWTQMDADQGIGREGDPAEISTFG